MNTSNHNGGIWITGIALSLLGVFAAYLALRCFDPDSRPYALAAGELLGLLGLLVIAAAIRKP